MLHFILSRSMIKSSLSDWLLRVHSLVAYILSQQSVFIFVFFFFSSRRRHTRLQGDWSSDVCSSDLVISDVVMDELMAASEPKRTLLLEQIKGLPVLPLTPAAEHLAHAYVRHRSEERRVGKVCRSRWSPYH